MSNAGTPTHIGKYRLDGLLGKGAMGVVYRAIDPLIERTVALKTVRRDLGDDEQAREIVERFRKEAQAAGRLMHSNIVAVHEYGESEDIAYIAMEFVDGTPLSALMGERPCPVPQALDWFSDLLAALDYSHQRGVVHRDIKPANLLVTRDGRIKVSDFGIARIESSTLTQTGAMLGTPSYMSPEQFRGEAIDGRSDLFSAGIVLYQLLTAQRPFSGSAATVMQQVLNHTPQQPSLLNATLPPGLDTVIMQALAKDPRQRHASARAFQLALNALLRDGATAGTSIAAPAQQQEQDSDATILAAPASLHALSSQPGWADRSRGGTGTGSQPAWLLAMLPSLEIMLTRQIGPMAKLLLRKIAASSPDFDSLGRQLLEHIPSPAAKTLFQQQLTEIGAEHLPATATRNLRTDHGTAGPATAPTQPAPTLPPFQEPANAAAPEPQTPAPAPKPLTPEFATAVTPILAAAIGPIAAIVVKRAARQADQRDDFITLLATHIDVTSARDRFLENALRLAETS
jgi:serine/threonine-protein kinase